MDAFRVTRVFADRALAKPTSCMPRVSVWQAPAVPYPQHAVLSLPLELSMVRPVPPTMPAQQAVPVAVSQKLPVLQTVLSVQAVSQLPVCPQEKPFGQVTPASGRHEPSPSQALTVNVFPAQTCPQAVVAAGYTQAPVLSQAVAPQVGLAVLHAALQQFPVPLIPQTPETHAPLPAQAPPAAIGVTQFPPEHT